MTEYILLGAIGFLAQMIDGALGMAFGVVSTTAMLSMGMPPAQASAIVHTAEIFTTGASATSHYYHRNIDWRLVIRLGIAGVAGAILGAWVLSNIDAAIMRPFVAAYLVAASASSSCSKPGKHHPGATRRRRGSGRSGSWRAFSMRAAAVAGGR